MDFAHLLLYVCAVLYLYCTGGSWMLQRVSYPAYHLVGEKEFVPCHVDSGKQLLGIFVGPAVLACLLGLALLLVRPSGVPFFAALLVAVGSLVILVTTVALEAPKHNRLDKDGKSTALIDGLVRDNLPRALSWTLGSALPIYMVAESV